MKATDITRALTRDGWTLVRERKHLVWQHPEARGCLVTAATPSDQRALVNTMKIAKRLKEGSR